ncbi:MAG: FtsW/RodA/SpoVE family cell cycle protein [Mogibacterium sp.]|nr:FtsW/RodA/SpoVE family cell cycle protein [Mogibacterium sp.]
METWLARIISFAEQYPEIAKDATTVMRWVFVVLAAYILLVSIFSLLTTRCTPEIWGYFLVEDGGNFPITHWENVIGRSRSSDIHIPLKTMSNSHAILSRKSEDKWVIKDLGSKNGTVVNGFPLEPGRRYMISLGDEIVMGGVHATVAPASLEESRNNEVMRRLDKEPVAPWKILVAITLFQFLTIIQLILGLGDKITLSAIISILLLSAVMWTYVTVFKAIGRKGFEMEMIAFFMSTINLAVTTSFDPGATLKEFIALLMGLALMIFMCIYLRDLERTRKLKPVLIGLSVVLLILNLLLGTASFGATNWIEIGNYTFQPSEIVKLAFICVGAGTLEELYNKRNTIVYAGFSLFCLACLALMSDFGTALIFFATYLVVSFLRSGDFSRLIFTGAGAGAMGVMILKFKPYIASRFQAWGHVWEPEFVDSMGYQQTRTMSFGAGGGLLGLGAGNGSLKYVGASNTDLVFGFVMEEWGFIIAALLVLCLITLTIFAVMSIIAGRSTFYTICACGAATMFLVQTMLNVFGAVDLFPLTGVTFPFVSTGGTSLLTSWAMLAYFKASDMRRNASLAVGKEEQRA